jgi:hypothetical protein
MLKKILIATAVSGLTLSTALAQAPDTKAPSSNAPAATQSTPAPSPAAKAPSTNMPAASSASMSGKFITTQTSDQWMASKFIGTDVVGSNNEKIGDVDDVLFDKSGKILGYVVGVGGFLGIGSKDVALAPDAFEAMAPGGDNKDWKLKLAMTKDELKNASEFKAYEPPRATVGAGTGTSNRPAPATSPGGMSPGSSTK